MSSVNEVINLGDIEISTEFPVMLMPHITPGSSRTNPSVAGAGLYLYGGGDVLDFLGALSLGSPSWPGGGSNPNTFIIELDTTGLSLYYHYVIIAEYTISGIQHQTAYTFRVVNTTDALIQIQTVTDTFDFTGSNVNSAPQTPPANMALETTSQTILSEVENIQNNTNFVGIVPTPIIKPESGTKNYKFIARLYDTEGNPEDPDSNSMTIRADDTSGVQIFAAQPMTRTNVGQYEYTRSISDLETEQPWVMHFEYDENVVAFDQVRTTEVVAESPDGVTLADSVANKDVIKEAVFDDPDILALGTKTFREILRETWATLIGNFTRSGDRYIYKDDNDTTTVIEQDVDDTGRSRV